MKRYRFPWLLILAVVLAVTTLFFVGHARIAVDTDILDALPQGDPIITSAKAVIAHHPIQERIVIDVGHRQKDSNLLVAAAVVLEKKLQAAGLFKSVGLSREQGLIPDLIVRVTEDFSVQFDEQELRESIAPRLAPEKIKEALGDDRVELAGLEGIGQTALIARDPLNFRSLILRRMAPLAPSSNVAFSQGQLLSADGGHLLILAEPITSGYDTSFSRQVTALIADAGQQLNKAFAGRDVFVLTPVGGYRAALDNEMTTKRDTQRAVVISTFAIALLLILGFPRPWIGILALFPAFAGTMVAIFVYSLFQRSISILAIGFGGAVISFTVDYGIAYLLFLDRPHETHGLQATKEVWSLGLLAMLTTAVSFACLFIAGFPALAQLGYFAALGVAFTYVFVHAVYPFLFPHLPPARRTGFLPLQKVASRLAKGGWLAAVVATVFGVFMLFFAKPEFRVDLASMNCVTRETLAAEKLIRSVWGDVFSRVFLATEGNTLAELRSRDDRLARVMDAGMSNGTVSSAFLPAMIFPGQERAKRNFSAWQAFWTQERVAGLRRTFAPLVQDLGFSPQAFAAFFSTLEKKDLDIPTIPVGLFPLLSIVEQPDGSYRQFSSFAPGASYEGEAFYRKMAGSDLAKVFDPVLFSQRLGSMILHGFLTVAAIVGFMTFLVSLFYLLHLRLTLIALLPTVFSLVCTIGTLRLGGQPLGIPFIVVSVVVIGMGTDYALYLVRSYQRYMHEEHPSLQLIRLSIFLSFATTFIGFGVLAFSDHTLLKSAGLALALGIGYSYLGTVALVPPLLRRMLIPVAFGEGSVQAGSPLHGRHTRRHYRHMEGHLRLLARYKLWRDPMFPRLASFVREPRVILDIGTGFGLPAVWLLELFPQARVYGIEPDPTRALVASQAMAGRGHVSVGLAPSIPMAPAQADTVTLLDTIHCLSDEVLASTLQRLRGAMLPQGRLIIRTTLPTIATTPWLSRLDRARRRLLKIPTYDRLLPDIEKALASAGFRVTLVEREPERAEHWIVAELLAARTRYEVGSNHGAETSDDNRDPVAFGPFAPMPRSCYHDSHAYQHWRP